MVDQSNQSNEPFGSSKDLDDGLGGLSTPSQDDIDQEFRARDLALVPQRIILPEGATKADAVVHLSKDVPNNEYGLPVYFLRSDLLPYPLTTLTTADVDPATVELDYSEGYPTYSNGKIFWQQLPHEPFSDFLLFQKYLDQAMELGIRQIQLLAMDNGMSLQKVSDCAKEYLWTVRARAFDLFQVAAEKKRRELRARQVESRDYEMAGQLIAQLLAKFEDPDYINTMSPNEAVKALIDLAKLRRISLGLSANGNAGAAADNPNSGATAEFIMRNITKSIGSGEDQGGLTPELISMMSDPNFTMQAQELIFRVQRGGEQ